jgi:hypothetical protein
VAIDDENTFEAVALEAPEKSEQDCTVGRDVEGKGAAELHVVLGLTTPERRRDHDRYVWRSYFSPRLAHAFAEDCIDTNRQMWPALLYRGDRQHNDCVRSGLSPEVFGSQLLP